MQKARWIGIAAVVVLAATAYFLMPRESSKVAPTGEFARAQRGPLTIGVNSSGTIRNENAVIIKNGVEGSTSILWIIEEGKQVEAGQLLMRLDSSELQDEEVEEEIEVETSRASLINAQQMLEITRRQGEANIEAAVVNYRLALLDVEKYTGVPGERLMELEGSAGIIAALENSVLVKINQLASSIASDETHRTELAELIEQLEGGYKQELRRAINSILLADAERLRAKTQVEGSAELFARNFISATELESDQLNLQRSQLDLQVSVGELELLARFTYKRTIEELASAANQSRFNLERAHKEAEANIVDAEANMHYRRERLVRDEQSLREIREQLEACEVSAPQAGMVVYGTTGQDRDDREEPLAEGVTVREQQDLFRLPTSDRLAADIKIHESVLETVEVGMPVFVTTDALPGRRFFGEITKIAVLPDAQSRWMNPNLKVYNTTVRITGDHVGLRTGMSCVAEIVVAEFEDTLYVPVQSVVRVDGQATVYVPTAEGGLEPRAVEVGLDDNRRMQVLSGLNEGDLISLTPPLQESEVQDDTVQDDTVQDDTGEDGAENEDTTAPDPAARKARAGAALTGAAAPDGAGLEGEAGGVSSAGS